MGRHRVVFVLGLALAVLGPTIATATDIPLRNWTPPQSRTPLADASGFVVSFMPVTPCRLADTRGNGFSGAYGTPQLVGGGAARSFPIPSNPTCTGIPSGASAFSLNFTVVAPPSTPAGGYLTVFPQGGTQPVVSTLNFGASSILANAAVVPAGTSGGISVFVNFSTDLIIDINGYYIGSGGSTDMNPGVYAGFSGNHTAGLLFAQNKNTTSTSTITSAVRGYITTLQNGPSAVLGQAAGGTGANFGVSGQNSSTDNDSAGVHGLSGSSPGMLGVWRAGVRGEGAGSSYGVVGVATYNGVVGFQVDGAGTFLRAGRLGFSTYGVYSQGDFGGTGAKYFVEPHALDAKKIIKYIAMEGPESGTYFRGRARFAGKVAVIQVPEDFRMVTDSEGLTVHVTPIGKQASAWVTNMDLNEIVIESTRDVEFSYIVHGVRRAFKGFQPIQEGDEFAPEGPNDKLPRYLTEESRQRLLSNGTYNTDGTVNMRTAERMGWAQKWRDEEKARQEAAARAAQESRPGNGPAGQ